MGGGGAKARASVTMFAMFMVVAMGSVFVARSDSPEAGVLASSVACLGVTVNLALYLVSDTGGRLDIRRNTSSSEGSAATAFALQVHGRSLPPPPPPPPSYGGATGLQKHPMELEPGNYSPPLPPELESKPYPASDAGSASSPPFGDHHDGWSSSVPSIRTSSSLASSAGPGQPASESGYNASSECLSDGTWSSSSETSSPRIISDASVLTSVVVDKPETLRMGETPVAPAPPSESGYDADLSSDSSSPRQLIRRKSISRRGGRRSSGNGGAIG